jgi:hypothetical protein
MIVDCPASEIELIDFTLVTVASEFSSGLVTSDSISSGPAP